MAILTEKRGRVALITLNRPEALNALNNDTMLEVTQAVQKFDADAEVGAIVITGSDKAFAAGADIKEMSSKTATEMYNADWFAGWDVLTRARTPIIAAVNGYALGGGCELAMMCDFIIAGDKAKFGQPEVNLGVTPGMGGSQRLTRAIGKAKAMEMCLTGRMMAAEEAERSGLVARVVPADELLDSALETAELIASKSFVATSQIKEQVNAVDELSLSQGIQFERRTFHALFSSHDQKEGMTAFVEKRDPDFKHA
ncbi:enoyl-CoA hydratase [Corynebacterium sp. UMB6689]|uniref:Probable enoyl-CoA hydratase echA8 n=1 Tax=Corynebacterium aurimucosum TaxID=169292 RepID=A0A558GH95_9CORY|nr:MULTISPECIES: enoyl-CoA hydratase [unclassified Corynebacterium]MDK6813626.1 enoyl-CoA hydratase [Corynebacterium sp. UMB6689]OFL21071.1 enoyl-CoA hydratase [Corynebacterium sp. HMSC062A03]OFS39325.1 enoyl-CoA hydratase [Corynebacterium sp. HMSC069E04]TVU56229.1 enoyl-CoA hydratase [Corynebacterium aurimucosum]